MKKILIISALILSFVLSMPISALARSVDLDFVVDEADVLTPSQEAKLEKKIEKLIKEHKMDIVIVTVDSTGIKNVDSYANDYYSDNGYGYGKRNSGIMVLLVTDIREFRIYTYGDGYEKFSDSDIDEILDAMLPHFENDEFYDGFMAYADACDDVLSYDVFGSLLVAVVIGAVVSLIIVFSMKSKLRSVRPQKTASNYVRTGSFMLTKDLDLYLYRTITRTPRANNNSGGRSGGGSRGGSRGGGKF